MLKINRTLSTAALSVALTASAVLGAGFQIPEQGVGAMGAGMGSVGLANDLSAVYQNPAGLTQLNGMNAYVSLVTIMPKATYTRQSVNPLTGAQAVAGPEDAVDDPIPVPAFTISRSINDGLTVAFAVMAPFGLSSEYADSGVQRYMTTNISLTTAYIGPYVGWQATPELSIGAGLQYVYGSAELGQHANYGGALLQMAATSTALAAGLAEAVGGDIRAANENPALDGIVDITDATASAIAFNVGVLYKINDQAQVGATFRKGVDLEVDGDVSLTVPALVTQLSGGLMQSLETSGGTTISLPDIYGVGVAYSPTEELVLTSEINYIAWSGYEDIDFDFAANDDNQMVAQYFPDSANPRYWDDSIAFRIGAQYQLQEQHTLRCGYLYDQSPIPDKSHGPELPTNDRNGVTLGYGIDLGQFTVDLALAHLFISDRTVELADTIRGKDAATGQIDNPSALPLGDYEGSANIAGLGVSFSF
jgi:long-chain fatty acid transport protein